MAMTWSWMSDSDGSEDDHDNNKEDSGNDAFRPFSK
jgi:hypothetical protein